MCIDESFYKPQKSGSHKRARRYFVEEYGEEGLSMCFNCFSQENIHLHHADGNPFNNDIDNLIPLCEECHKAEHRLLGGYYK